METKKQKSIKNFLQTYTGTLESYKEIDIIKYLYKNEKPACCIWASKSHKPTYCYFFNTEQGRDNFIDSQKQKADKMEQDIARYNEKKNLFVPGAILFSSWGYEQTNIDFYIILSRKNDFVIIQEIGQNRTYDSQHKDSGRCTPNENIKLGDPFKKKITKYASLTLNTYSYCSIWDGTPKSWSSYA